MSNREHVLSPLNKTWIFDIDGTIVKHNGYKIDGYDSLLDGAKEFLDGISSDDFIVFITSRDDSVKEMTIDFLKENHIRYDQLIFNAPYGERIIINDKKPSGLKMSVAINTERDRFMEDQFVINTEL